MPSPHPDHYLAPVREALPGLLQRLDRDPTSRTYGSFDRQHWHYRALDFPCGMAQEFALPLALVWRHKLPGLEAFHQRERMREWVVAAIRYAAASAHPDGSCDDYYPYERALGAAVFSLYALAESARLVGVDTDPEILAFLRLRADWTMAHDETGVLSNHHAIAAAALAVCGSVCGEDRFLSAARAKAAETLGHQHDEGWFREYSGFDPGYQSVTIDFLARYWRESGDDSVLPALERGVSLLERVQHLDGSFGGEYAARNTHHTQGHGFEILASQMPAAGRIADRFLGAIAADRFAWNFDDRLIAHPVYPLIMAWLERGGRPVASVAAPPPEQTLLEGCGFWIDRREDELLLAGLAKGGTLRAECGEEILASDTGPTLRLEDGRVLVVHRNHDASFERSESGGVVTRGSFQVAAREGMTATKSVVLRVGMLTVGRFARNLVRKALQKRLITGSTAAPFRFERHIERDEERGGWTVTDRILPEEGAPPVVEAWLGVAQTSIYIAASQPWHPTWLLPWTVLREAPAELRAGRPFQHVRRIAPEVADSP